jgi:hypothetical protein
MRKIRRQNGWKQLDHGYFLMTPARPVYQPDILV